MESTDIEEGQGWLPEDSPRAGLGSKLLCAFVLLPSVLHLFGRGGEGWFFVLAGLLLPWLVGTLTYGPQSKRAGRVLSFVVGAALVVPMLPTVFHQFGFSTERVFFGSALSWLAWRGLLVPRATESSHVLLLRSLVIGWAMWSIGSTIHSTWVSYPSNSPWVVESFSAALFDPLGFRSSVDPTAPMLILWQRLEMLLLLWATLETALRDRGLAARVARALAVALPLQILVNLLSVILGTKGSLHPLSVRLSSSFDRVYRPLPDHNALGSALVIAIPFTAWYLWRGWYVKSENEPETNRRQHVALGAVALLSGLLMLVGTSSKSALLGLAIACGTGLCLWMAYARGRARRLLILAMVVGVTIPVGVQMLPQETLSSLMDMRYARDLVRAARFDFAGDYLRDNRYAVWRSGTSMIEVAPLTGIGLGRFPRVLPDYHDPNAEGHFNPLQENAHNQYLQWAAEDGLVGAGLGASIFLLALCVGAFAVGGRASKSPKPIGIADRLGLCVMTAALAGLSFNLLVGHALLIPTVAGLFAVVVGLVVASAARVLDSRTAIRRWPRFAASWLLLIPIGAASAMTGERTPLHAFQVDCFPWLWQPQVTEAPVISRLLGPDARWIERWGNGSRMVMLVKSIVAPHYGENQHLDVYVNDQLVVEGFALPRKSETEAANPIVVLKVDAPAGVVAGDLVQVRIVCDRPYAESSAGGHSQSMWGPRVWPPTFKNPSGRKTQ